MELKLLHLYHNLMNLYGEYGNIKALTRHLEDPGGQGASNRNRHGRRRLLCRF